MVANTQMERCQHECGTESFHLLCKCAKCGTEYPNKENELSTPAAPETPPDHPWTIETMRIINDLTSDIKGKAFDPDWFLLRQRFEAMEDRAKFRAETPRKEEA